MIEATRPAGSNFLQQQAKFDALLRELNYERPHEALAMQCPADVYQPSTRPYRGIGELAYPSTIARSWLPAVGGFAFSKRK